MRNITLPVLLFGLVACTSHKLEVRLNGQRTQSMEARVEKENGRRIVDLSLPGGWWAVSATESGISPHIVQIDGIQHVRIELPPDRLVSVKPIIITLQALDREGKPVGTPYTVSLNYSNSQQKESRFA